MTPMAEPQVYVGDAPAHSYSVVYELAHLPERTDWQPPMQSAWSLGPFGQCAAKTPGHTCSQDGMEPLPAPPSPRDPVPSLPQAMKSIETERTGTVRRKTRIVTTYHARPSHKMFDSRRWLSANVS
jgi:hypothetical protein